METEKVKISELKPYEKNAKKHPQKQKECILCGKWFSKGNKLSDKQWKKQRYCSVRCVKNDSKKVKYNCKNCNKNFYDYPSNGFRKFCSLKCKNDFNRVSRICKNCGKSFNIAKSLLKDNNNSSANFCSRQCYNDWLCKTDKIMGRGSRWKQKRREVLKEFPYCQFCGKRDGLQVHHIVPYRITQDNGKDNLIPLCHKHHKELETITHEIEIVENNWDIMKEMIKNMISDRTILVQRLVKNKRL